MGVSRLNEVQRGGQRTAGNLLFTNTQVYPASPQCHAHGAPRNRTIWGGERCHRDSYSTSAMFHRTLAPRARAPRALGPRTLTPRTLAPRTSRPRTLGPRTLAPRTSYPRTSHPGTSHPRTSRQRTSDLAPSHPRTSHSRTSHSRTLHPRPPRPSQGWTAHAVPTEGAGSEYVFLPQPPAVPRFNAFTPVAHVA